MNLRTTPTHVREYERMDLQRSNLIQYLRISSYSILEPSVTFYQPGQLCSMLSILLTTAIGAFPNPMLTLNNGVIMPQLALGTWQYNGSTAATVLFFPFSLHEKSRWHVASSAKEVLAIIFCAIPLASAMMERARAPSPNKQTKPLLALYPRCLLLSLVTPYFSF